MVTDQDKIDFERFMAVLEKTSRPCPIDVFAQKLNLPMYKLEHYIELAFCWKRDVKKFKQGIGKPYYSSKNCYKQLLPNETKPFKLTLEEKQNTF